MDDVIKYIKLEDAKKIIRDGVSTDTDEDKDYVCDLLSCLPTIEAIKHEQKWIPCIKELPDTSDDVLVTYEYGFAKLSLDDERVYHDNRLAILHYIEGDYNVKVWFDGMYEIPEGMRIIAWMPLPEPYEGE